MANKKRVVIEVARRGRPGDVTQADLAEVVPPIVDQRLSESDAPAAAAALAVTAEIAGRDMLESHKIAEPDLAFAVVDEDGRRTWLEAGMDGRPTEYAAMKSGLPTKMNTGVTGLSFAIVDEDGRRTDLEVAPDGRFTDRVVNSLRERLGVIPVPEEPETRLAFWGDSLTEAGWPSQIAASTGLPVQNFGIGGDTSVGIIARAGVQPFRVAPAGGMIPASGTVAITLAPVNDKGFNIWPGMEIPGTIRGVPGVVQAAGDPTRTFSFARDAAGAAIPITDPAIFIPDAYATLPTHTHVLWAGNNNASDTAQVIADTTAFVHALGHTRYLILTMVNNDQKPEGTAGYNDVIAINTALVATYGIHCLDIRAYLIAHGLADAGITPTATDIQNIADGIVPASLRSDTIHHNATGNQLIAAKVTERLTEMELI